MSGVIVVHGYAGSGKSTHSERLANEGLDGLSVYHVSAGNRLRAIRNNIVPSQFSEFINNPSAPSPLPDPVMNRVIFEAMEAGTNHDLILSDGYPRRKRTVRLFHNSLQEHGHELLGTIFLRIPKSLSIRRISERGERPGDKVVGGSLRQDAEQRFNRNTQRVRLAVRALGHLALVEEINADRSLEDVFADFSSAVGRMALADASIKI